MSGFDKKLKRVIKLAEAQDAGWSWDRPKQLIIRPEDTIESLLMNFSINFQWWRTRWDRMDEIHQNALITLFHAHPPLLQHVWAILDKNLDENSNLKHGIWKFNDLEFTLFEKLGLMNDEIECEIYRIKSKEE